MSWENNFIPWDDMVHKEYTKEQMKSYAEYCMRKLVTKYPNGIDEMGEISGTDLDKIGQILNGSYVPSPDTSTTLDK